MRRALLLTALLSVSLQAEPPSIGQATHRNYPNPVAGSTSIGVTAFGLTVAQASATVWVFELDGKPWFSLQVDCTDKYSSTTLPLCDVPTPVLQDVGRVRVRAAGSTEWSNTWLMAMVPCGHFIGERVFRNSLEVMGWAHSDTDRGGPCAGAPTTQPTPAAPAELRILK